VYFRTLLAHPEAGGRNLSRNLVPVDQFTCRLNPLTPDASLTYKVLTLSVGLPNLTHTCSNLASSMGTKKVARIVVGQMAVGVGDGG
jgi:hypothetical protein